MMQQNHHKHYNLLKLDTLNQIQIKLIQLRFYGKYINLELLRRLILQFD